MVQQSSPGTADAGGRGLRVSGGAVASLIGLGLLVVFMVQNTERITLSFLFWSFTWPLWLFTIAMATLGSIVWIGLGILRRHRRRVARRAARRD